MRDLSFQAAELFRSPQAMVLRMRSRREKTKTMTRKHLRFRLAVLEALMQAAAQGTAAKS